MKPEGDNQDAGFRRLWRDWLSHHRALILAGLGLMVVTAAAAAGYSKMIQMIITAYETADASVIYWGPISIIALTTIRGFSAFFQVLSINTALTRFEADLQKSMYLKLLGADLARLQEDSPASLAARFTADVGLTRSSVQQIMAGLSSALIIVATVIVMLSIDWFITVIMVFIFLIAVAPTNVIGAKVRKITASAQHELTVMNSDIVEGLSSIKMARSFQLEDRLEANANSIFERLLVLKVKLMKWQARMAPVIEILSGAAIAALLFIVSWRISRGTITIADFMGLLTGVGVIAQPARGIGLTYTSIMQGSVAIGRCFGILDEQNRIVDASNPKIIDRVAGNIEFKNVDFAYQDGFAALRDVSLNIPAGAKVAFVGRSGAGKSTAFNLLPRLYDVNSGSITIDGTDIRDISIASLRKQIAVVGQDSVLMAGTIAENIGFGKTDASRDEIIAAAKAASADGFIKKQKLGYDTVISPSEGSFSGGEKQRISIARAILRDAPILLLDEPTSALDAESEAAIRKALDELSADRTTLIIAHRLTTILDADLIVVMDEGRIVESGTHEELLAKNGLYADLYSLQFAGT